MMKKFLTLLILCSACHELVWAQSQTGSIVGRVTRDGVGGRRGQGLDGVAIRLIAGADTSYATTLNGAYAFRKVAAGKVALRFSYVGLKTVDMEVQVQAGRTTYRNTDLQDAVNELGAVTVRGTIAHMTKSGDTLVFNPDAVKTLQGDYAEEILKQMPGIEVEDGKITVMGKDVSRVYVDGRLLFGQDTKTAIQNLMANDVKKIQVFDEDSEETLRSGRKHDEKRRVLNIETKSKLLALTSGHALGSLGADVNRSENSKHQLRYSAGLTLRYFSDNLGADIDLGTGNIGRTSNRMGDILSSRAGAGGGESSYSRNNNANIGIERRWVINLKRETDSLLRRSKHRLDKRLSLSYSYTDSYTRSASSSEGIYYPSSLWQTRSDYDTTRNISKSATHSINLRMKNDYAGYTFESQNKIWDRSSDNYRGVNQMWDDANKARSSNDSRNKSNGYDLNPSANWNYKTLSLSGSFNFSENDGNGWRADTMPYVDNKVWINNSDGGYTRRFNASAGKNFMLINNERSGLYLKFDYGFVYNKSLTRRMAIDQYTGQVDPGSTNDYMVDNNTHSAKGGVSYYIRDRFNINAALGFNSTGINRDEHYPETYSFNERFNSFLPSVQLSYGQRLANELSLSYTSSPNIPSINQLREKFDDSESLIITTGNPNLKQSTNHNVNLVFSNMNSEKARETRLNVSFSTTIDAITSNKYTFAEGGTWNGHTIAPGTTLYTYDNVNGTFSLSGGIIHNSYLSRLKSKATLAVRVTYSETPSYIEDKLQTTKNISPTLSLGLNSNFSRKFSFKLNANSIYRFAQNSERDDDKSLNQTVGATLRWDVTSWFFMNANYSYSKYFSIAGLSQDNENQNLNAVVGFKAFKRMCDVSVAAYDILGRETNFTSTVYADRVSNSWRQTFGRYYIVSLSYRINATHSATKDFNFFGRRGGDGPEMLQRGDGPGMGRGGMMPMGGGGRFGR